MYNFVVFHKVTDFCTITTLYFQSIFILPKELLGVVVTFHISFCPHPQALGTKLLSVSMNINVLDISSQ